MDVLTAAWTASGSPQPDTATARGDCGRCGRHDRLVPTGDVVSRSFTGFDTWRDPGAAGVCPPCTWGHRTPVLRAAAHRVTSDPPELTRLDRVQLGHLLDVPLAPRDALVVPLRPGRKHLLPDARWGRITIDNAQLPWTLPDARRLGAARRLRALGFGSRMLAEPSPPWPVLRRLPRNWWLQAVDDWWALEPWRARRPWLELAVHITAPAERAPA